MQDTHHTVTHSDRGPVLSKEVLPRLSYVFGNGGGRHDILQGKRQVPRSLTFQGKLYCFLEMTQCIIQDKCLDRNSLLSRELFSLETWNQGVGSACSLEVPESPWLSGFWLTGSFPSFSCCPLALSLFPRTSTLPVCLSPSLLRNIPVLGCAPTLF